MRIEDRAQRAERRALRVTSRRPTPTNADEDLFTAEASLDAARDPEPVEGQRAQRMAFLFVGRRRQTKTYRLWGIQPWLKL